MNYSINCHSSIKIDNLYFDPYNITKKQDPAKIIFITHPHYDHLDINSIKNIIADDTIIFATEDSKLILEKEFKNKIVVVKPNESYNFQNLFIETFPSYNLDKDFHKKENNWVGYKITYNNTAIAICGDTDSTPELQNLKCDILFIPIGGTYTMTAQEAAKLTKIIKPKIVIPTHYGEIVGEYSMANKFISLLSKSQQYEILIIKKR